MSKASLLRSARFFPAATFSSCSAPLSSCSVSKSSSLKQNSCRCCYLSPARSRHQFALSPVSRYSSLSSYQSSRFHVCRSFSANPNLSVAAHSPSPEVVIAGGDDGGDIEALTEVPGAVWPVDPRFYEEQLAVKVAKLKERFRDMKIPEIEIFRSPPINYRMRAEFQVSRRGGRCHYIMNEPGTRHKVRVEKFPTGSLLLNQVMEGVLVGLDKHAVLLDELFGLRLYSTLSGQGMVTFLYREAIPTIAWRSAAKDVQATFAAAGISVNLIGRSRKYVVSVGEQYVDEVLNVRGKNYVYRQYESEFSQPNAIVNQHMLGWAQQAAQDLNLAHTDLVELYCGNGNFTLPIASHFRKVFATELSKVGIVAATHNVETAGLTNVTLGQMLAMDFSKSLRNIRQPSPFVKRDRLGLSEYDFQTVLLDPPRPGADVGTLRVLQDTPNVIYISCNPVTLHANLETLTKHEVRRFAVFDQFPYTDHLEVGVILGPKST